MKRILLTMLLVTTIASAYSQTTYYWVGNNGDSINVLSNWNTALNGSGSARTSNTNATDRLIVDGTNLGGITFLIDAYASIACAELKFVNNAVINMIRGQTGTTTITFSGNGTTDEDFVIESGSSLSVVPSTLGSIRFALGGAASPAPPPSPANTGRVSGSLSMISGLQVRIDYTTTGTPGSLVFTNGSTFTTNITPASASYGFGNSTQSPQRWVVFEAGSHLYYNGGFSPHGSGTLFSAIDMRSGSTWHHRANNGVTSVGNFFNRQSYGNIIVENNATLTAMGTIYRIENLTIDAGSTFIPAATGQTVVTGNLIANGNITLPAGGTNRLVLGGNTAQTVSGTGNITLSGFTVADKADVTLNRNISVDADIDIYGKLNFLTNKFSGNAPFYAAGVETVVAGTGNIVAGSYFITGNTAFGNSSIGRSINGTGIAPSTSIVSFSSSLDSMYISQPILSTVSGVSLTATNSGATLVTANTNGFDPLTGSASTTGNKTYGDSINYVINAATTSPFGVTTGTSGNLILVGFAEINAPVTVNTGLKVHSYLTLSGKMILRPLDLLHIAEGSIINGAFSSSNYIATDYNSATGAQSILQYDGLATATTLPIGTINYYLPAIINPANSSSITAAVFQGMTTNGAVNGIPLSPTQKQSVVDAVWNINRLSGTGNATLQLGWNVALEGSKVQRSLLYLILISV
jgi:trimeric autotransporter adhesin